MEHPNVELLRRAWAAYDRGDEEAFAACLTDDWRGSGPERTAFATHTGRYLDLDPTGKRAVVHEMMFNRVRDGRLAETWAMEDGPGFYEQLTGRKAPQPVDNIG